VQERLPPTDCSAELPGETTGRIETKLKLERLSGLIDLTICLCLSSKKTFQQPPGGLLDSISNIFGYVGVSEGL